MTLYETIKAAGIEIDHHESDLQFPVTKETTAILKAYNLGSIKFRDNVSGKLWYEVPFAYDPAWRTK